MSSSHAWISSSRSTFSFRRRGNIHLQARMGLHMEANRKCHSSPMGGSIAHQKEPIARCLEETINFPPC